MMIVIAMMLVSLPIVMILYYSAQKSWLYYKQNEIKRKEAAIEVSLSVKPILKNDSMQENQVDDKELTAVITAAVNMYIQGKNRSK